MFYACFSLLFSSLAVVLFFKRRPSEDGEYQESEDLDYVEDLEGYNNDGKS